MRGVVTTLGLAALGAWTYLLAFHGRFWSVRENHKRPRSAPGYLNSASTSVRDLNSASGSASVRSSSSTRGSTSVGRSTSMRGSTSIIAVVPARNEADVIARSVTSLLKQPELSHVILVDDNSSDATASIARTAAAQIGQLDRLTVVNAAELPAGWSGKLWAMQRGVRTALMFGPDYLLFTDADIIHSPNSTATLVALAEERGCDLVSFMAKLHCRSNAEKWLIPAFVFFFFKLYPPRWIASQRHKTAGAAGGCILVKSEALSRSGGLEAIRSEIIDDCAMAKAVKRSGGKVLLSLTDLVASERPYDTADIERMISRTAFSQLRHSSWLLAGSLAGLTLLYIVPPAMLIAGIFRSGTAGDRAMTALGAIVCLMMSAAYVPMVRFYRLNPLWALSLPAAALFYMGATVHSALTFLTGQGGRWKGRIQDPAVASRT